MRWALIESGHVANVVEEAQRPRIPGQWVACGAAGPGWSYDGSSFAPPPAPPTPTVAPIISKRQARRALLAAGLLDDVEDALDTLPEPQLRAVRIDYEDATEWRRDWPTLLAVQAALGWTDTQVDDLFAAAALL